MHTLIYSISVRTLLSFAFASCHIFAWKKRVKKKKKAWTTKRKRKGSRKECANSDDFIQETIWYVRWMIKMNGKVYVVNVAYLRIRSLATDTICSRPHFSRINFPSLYFWSRSYALIYVCSLSVFAAQHSFVASYLHISNPILHHIQSN